MNRVSVALGIVLFFITLLNVQSQSWPQFRGPNSSGVPDQKEILPTEFNEATLKWKTPLPVGHSSPCIWGDDLFLTAYIEDSSELQTICINRINGKIKWKRSIFPKKIEGYHPISNAAQTSPTTDGTSVYVYFGSYGILCYSISGELLWEYKIEVHPYRWGVTSSPILCENKLILYRDISNEWFLMAFDKAKGDILWKADLPKLNEIWTTNWATPVIFRNQIVLHRTGEIVGYNIENGERVWWFPYLSSGTSTPIINNDLIYVGTWHNYSESDQRSNFPQYHDFQNLLNEFDTNNDSLIQQSELPDSLYFYVRPEISGMETADGKIKNFFGVIDQDKDENISESEWDGIVEWIISDFYKEAGLIALNPNTKGELNIENVIWRELDKVPEVPSPIYYNGLIYMCKNGGILTCMDALNGTIYYRERIGVSGAYFASPVATNNFIYILSGNGIITVIQADRKFKIVSQNDLQEKVYATPAISDNTIYIRTTEYLYAFGE